jgi:asparagine synthase (glutamine-hydrolysing)
MCGIFGLTNFKEKNIHQARSALHTLIHRGPDQWGEYYDENVYIGHRRLSILDLSENGRQPMVSPGRDVVISVNGEIYNFQDIKKELDDKYQFRSTSDSEVILHGYIEWGIDKLLEKIDGMYAFSIYDKRKDILFLVRDRVGIKPLFYGNVYGQISWASELKALQKFYEDGNVLENDYTAFYDFLTYLYIPTPKTMYKNMYKLEPAHYLKVDIRNSKIFKVCYWKLEVKNNLISEEDASLQLFDLVQKSVQEQMVSDVPVGFFLSGGMDSSTVVALASSFSTKINTFSIGFSDKRHDETNFAQILADKYHTTHRTKILDATTTKQLFHKIKEWYDEPYADTSCFPTYLVSKFSKKFVTVVLTGDGGDEIFGGYNWYSNFLKKRKTRFPKLRFLFPICNFFKNKSKFASGIANRFEYFISNDLEVYTKLMGGMLKEHKKQFRSEFNISEDYDDYWYFRKFYKKEYPIMTRLQYLDFHTYLHDDILTKVDRVSMAVSLECRVPFLSRDVIEFLFSLNHNIRNKNNSLKYIMKNCFNKYIPDEILNRSKKGFSIPLHTWKKEILGNENIKQIKIMNDFL